MSCIIKNIIPAIIAACLFFASLTISTNKVSTNILKFFFSNMNNSSINIAAILLNIFTIKLPNVLTNDCKLLSASILEKLGLTDFITICNPNNIFGLNIANITALGIIFKKSLLIATFKFKSIPEGMLSFQSWSLDILLTNPIKLSAF